MPNIIKQLANRMGYELKRKYGTLPPLDFLETLLLGAVAAQGKLNIVQVGANDGSYSDPIHRFLMGHVQRTEVLLIEPHPAIINFESKHLGEARKVALEAYLSSQGYTLYQWNKTDTVALRLS